MAYQTYTTQALVCGTVNRNTADRSCLLFTREAGMLYADARSVREERSRQRYALQEFSLLRVSLVRGKRGWRVGSIEPLKNYYHQAVDRAARGSVVDFSRLLRRFVSGEQPDRMLFDQAINSLEILVLSVPEREFVSLVLQVRLLATLGYVNISALPISLLEGTVDTILSHSSNEVRKQVDALYSKAITMSHL